MARPLKDGTRYQMLMNSLEKELLQSYLAEFETVEETAAYLGLSTSTLYRKINNLNISLKPESDEEPKEVVAQKGPAKKHKEPKESKKTTKKASKKPLDVGDELNIIEDDDDEDLRAFDDFGDLEDADEEFDQDFFEDDDDDDEEYDDDDSEDE